MDPRTPVDDVDRLAKELKEISRRLDSLEAPTGTSAFRTVAKLQLLVEDIQNQLNTFMNGKYTNAQIDAFIAGRAPASHTHDQSQISGTWDKGINSGGNPVFFPNAYATDLTGTRRTAWLQSDGRLGYASSSETKKTRIRPADEERLARILEAEPRSFMYRAEIRRRTSERINRGRDYRPALEIGLLAEELEALGLGEFVYHDEDGAAEGIEYPMLVVALLAAGRDHERRLRALEG